MQSLLEDKLFNHEIGLEDNFDFLNLFIPCFEVHIPNVVRAFYDLITSKITLVGTGMGGVVFRESRAELSKILEDHGYCPVATDIFVNEYEDKLIGEYHDNQKKQEKKKGK